MLKSLIGALDTFVWAAACGFALWKGGRSEQSAAVLLIVAWMASLAAQHYSGLSNPQWLIVAVDVATLAALGAIAWRSERSWPIWAAALQSIGTATHVAYGLALRIDPVAYYAAVNLTAYGVAVALALGAFISWREQKALSGL